MKELRLDAYIHEDGINGNLVTGLLIFASDGSVQEFKNHSLVSAGQGKVKAAIYKSYCSFEFSSVYRQSQDLQTEDRCG